MLLYEFRNIKFCFATQMIFKSRKFFDYMSYLDINEYVNIEHKNHKKTFYTLTDWGRFQAIAFTKRIDCPKDYVFLNRKTYYDY